MSKLSFKRIEIENFRSIQSKITLDIKPGLFSIEGINMDEPGSFNGAGKSSILSALYWCLTGTALTNEILADEVVNIKSGKDCIVEVTIETKDDEIKIKRTRKHSEYGNNLFLFISGQDLSCHKVVDTQDRINKLLKIPYELLHSTIFLTHDIKSAFSELSPQQRINVLESIRDYSIWNKVRDEANKDIKTYNQQIKDLELEASKLDGSKITYQKMLNGKKEELNTLKQSDNNTLSNRITTLENENSELIAESKKYLAENEELSSKIIKIDDSKQETLDKIVDEANKLKLNVQSAEFSKKTIQNKIDTIDKWFKEDTCPTCGKPLDRTTEEINKKTQEKQEFNDEIAKIDTNITTLSNKIIDKRAEWTKLNTELQVLKAKNTENTNKIEKNNKILTPIVSKITINDKSISELKIQNENYQNNIDNIEKAIKSYTIEIEKNEVEIKKKDKEVLNLEYKRKLSDYFYKLLGSKGELRPFLLNNDINFLNLAMQKYISRFFKNTSVKLQLNGAAIDIIIDTLGIKKSISSLSGGEKKRLNLAIQFALYDLIRSTSQIDFNIICLDEIESELDTVGIQQLVEIIEDISERVETVFWITNHPIVKESTVHKIICKKICGKTEVEEQ